MSKHHHLKTILVITTGICLFLGSGQAFAWWPDYNHRHGYCRPYPGYYHYPRGRVELALSRGYFSIFLSSGRYYVCDGVYYRKERRGYVVIDPPAGAVIRAIPPYYNVVTINGTPYYTSDGIYYQDTPRGYMIVNPPGQAAAQNGVLVPPAQNAAPGPAITSDDAFTVNIPNTNGGYTTVIVKRSDNGFKGPQGEFYPEFPRVEQLRVMYAK